MCTRVRLYARGTGVQWLALFIGSHCFTCLHYNVLSRAIIKEVKGLTNKFYTYVLAWKKTVLHAKFQVHS